jgi:hypothetical protein
MNEQLQAQLAQVLSAIMTSVGEVKDFSVAQLPDIAQQYITYGIWVSSFWVVVSGLATIISWVCVYRIFRKYGLYDDRNAIVLPFIFIGIFSIILVLDNLHNLILITTAPKVWFILEIKNLIN